MFKTLKLIALSLIALIVIYAALFFEPQKEQEKPAPELGTIERLKHELEEKIGSKDALIKNGELTVFFEVPEGFSDAQTKKNARKEVVKILDAIKSSEIDFNTAICSGRHPLKDKFGKVDTTTTVIRVEYDKETVGKIEATSIDPNNIVGLASDVYLHPALK